jgi:hypothetical protein
MFGRGTRILWPWKRTLLSLKALDFEQRVPNFGTEARASYIFLSSLSSFSHTLSAPPPSLSRVKAPILVSQLEVYPEPLRS